jgi:hypothetical protein
MFIAGSRFFAELFYACSRLFIFIIMWMCPQCGQTFVNNNQMHSCGDKVLTDFLHNKSTITVALFWYFVETFQAISTVTIHPTKSMIAFAVRTRIAYVIRLGKNFVDVVFPFDRPYEENLCFRKIAKVPGQQQYNHHLRIMQKEDINSEVKKFMKLACDLDK